MRVVFGEASLDGEEVAPGSEKTLSMLSDPSKRPPTVRDPLPDDVVNHVPRTPLVLDQDKFGKNLRSAKRGVAAGPSSMTVEHIRPLLARILHSFFQMCERLAQANVPQVVVEAVRVGRMTALRKPDGGVRGIVAGDVIRRLVSRTIAKRHHTLPVRIVHTCWVRVHCPCFSRLVRAEPRRQQ